jgi:hypothetical protein
MIYLIHGKNFVTFKDNSSAGNAAWLAGHLLSMLKVMGLIPSNANNNNKIKIIHFQHDIEWACQISSRDSRPHM